MSPNGYECVKFDYNWTNIIGEVLHVANYILLVLKTLLYNSGKR